MASMPILYATTWIWISFDIHSKPRSAIGSNELSPQLLSFLAGTVLGAVALFIPATFTALHILAVVLQVFLVGGAVGANPLKWQVMAVGSLAINATQFYLWGGSISRVAIGAVVVAIIFAVTLVIFNMVAPQRFDANLLLRKKILQERGRE